jgi:hypothetical protein
MDGVPACFVEVKDPRANNAGRVDSHGSFPAIRQSPRATKPLRRSQAGLSHT